MRAHAFAAVLLVVAPLGLLAQRPAAGVDRPISW